MRKKSLLTKVVALGAMTTLLASSTAFAAATYSTRTLYKAGNNEGKVEVATIVTGLTENDEVTYLAGNADNPVYINQYTANPLNEGGKYVFKYTTDVSNLNNTSIKMAKTASDFTGGEEVTAESGNTVADPTAFTFNVTVDDAAVQTVNVADARSVEAAESVISLDVTGIGDNTIKTVKLNGEDVNLSRVVKTASGIQLTIPKALTTIDENDLSLTPTSATLVITTEKVAKNPEISYVGGYKAATYENATVAKEDGTTENITGPMFAMYGHAKDCDEFGVAVSFVGEWDGNTTAGKEVLTYKALANDDGNFAVAIIDDANAENCMKEAWARVYMTYTHDENIKRFVYGDLIHISFE